MNPEYTAVETSSEDILKLVQRYLDVNQPTHFSVKAANIPPQREGRWWYVVVQPSVPDVRSSEYNAVMSDVEELIEKEEGLHVLLVPSLVD